MRVRPVVLVVALCGLWSASAGAQTDAPGNVAAPPEAAPTSLNASAEVSNSQPRWALGLATSWARRRDFGALQRSHFIPEIVAQHYIAHDERFYLRPGLRLGYAGLTQAEMPQDLQVQEREGMLRAELAALYDGPVIPMLAVSAGLVVRRVTLATSGSVESDSDPISQVHLLPELAAKAGLGLPFIGGAVILEPHIGYRYVHGDDREGLFYGVDASYAWF